jgi:hypothetical protein
MFPMETEDKYRAWFWFIVLIVGFPLVVGTVAVVMKYLF